VAGDLAFFSITPLYQPAESYGSELWRSDGTVEGTFRILQTEYLFLDERSFEGIDGIAYFVNRDENGSEIWRSDGTAEGTYRLGEVVPGSGDGSPNHLTSAGGRLYFSADNGVTGRELWALQTSIFLDGFESGDLCDWTDADGESPPCP
jgi:ELWxxDGT repeat protein